MKPVILVNLNSLPGLRLGKLFPVGLTHLASTLERHDIDVRILDFEQYPTLEKQAAILADGASLVGFSIRSMDSLELNGTCLLPAYREAMQQIVEQVRHKTPAVRVVVGGTGFNLFARTLCRHLKFDLGITGFAEQTLLEIARDPESIHLGQRKLIAGSAGDHGLHQPLLLNQGLIKTYLECSNGEIGIQSSRMDCRYRCSYCIYGELGENCLGRRSLAVLQQDIRNLYAMGVRRVFFTEAVFNSSPEWAKQVCRAVMELGLRDLSWTAYFIPTEDQELLELARDSGCNMLIVSFDSFTPAVLKQLRKPFSIRRINAFLKLVRQVGIPLGAALLFGAPGETRQTIKQTCAYANQHLDTGELFFSMGVRIQPRSTIAHQMGLTEDILLPPTFLSFPQQLFDWTVDELDSRFLDIQTMHRMISLKNGYREMCSAKSWRDSFFGPRNLIQREAVT